MLRHLTSKIKATGPIPVAEYMREVLTNPVTVSDDRRVAFPQVPDQGRTRTGNTRYPNTVSIVNSGQSVSSLRVIM